MNISKDEKIERYLNELSDEYKKLLFKALISQSESMENLSVSDLLRLDAEIKKPLMEDYKRIQKRRNNLFSVGFIYVFIGIIMVIFPKIFFMANSFNIIDVFTLFSIIISFMGVYAILRSFMSPIKSPKYISNKKFEAKPVLEYELINTWRELEGKVNDIIEGNTIKSPRSIIGFLSENDFIDINESKVLQELLRMRNNIVHHSDVEYSEKELKEIIDNTNNILSKLNKIL